MAEESTTKKGIRVRAEDWSQNLLVTALICVAPLVVGAMAFGFKDAIAKAWPWGDWPGAHRTLVMPAILYWVSLFAGFVLYLFQKWGENSVKKRRETMPSDHFVSQFGIDICKREDTLITHAPRVLSAAAQDGSVAVRQLLESIADLSSIFDGRTGVQYAANVMLFIDLSQLSPYKHLLVFGQGDEQFKELMGALILWKKYSATAGDEKEDPHLSDLALPVPRTDKSDDKKKWRALPGAPRVYLRHVGATKVERMSIHGIDDLAKFRFDDLDIKFDEDRDKVRAYYSDTGQGSAVMSFMSFPMYRSKGDIFGTINVHCDRTNWANGSEERKQNCIALLMPLINSVGNVMELVFP